jgi:hypothetical protein
MRSAHFSERITNEEMCLTKLVLALSRCYATGRGHSEGDFATEIGWRLQFYGLGVLRPGGRSPDPLLASAA